MPPYCKVLEMLVLLKLAEIDPWMIFLTCGVDIMYILVYIYYIIIIFIIWETMKRTEKKKFKSLDEA